MKKKVITLLLGVAILALLIGVYALSSKKAPDNDENQNTEVSTETVSTETYTLIDKPLENISRLSINTGSELIYTPIDGGFAVQGYEDTQLNQSNITSVLNVFSTLNSHKIVVDAPEDLSIYGLASPQAKAVCEYTDGAVATLYIGDLTTDNSYYYAMLNDDTKVYLIDSLTGDRVLYGIGDLIDKNISTINSSTVTHVDIKQKGKDEILIVYDKDNAAVNENLEKNGLFTLTMLKPLQDVLVYPYNLQTTVLNSLSAISIKDVAAAAPSDLSVYGLSDPALVVELKDDATSLRLTVGDFVGDSDVYVMVNDRPEVFLMDKSAVTSFMNVNITDFIQKFVAIHTRSTLNAISLTSKFGDINIDFKQEGDNKIEDLDGVKKDMRNTYVNGSLVDRDTFTAFYELLVGISFDAIEPDAKPNGELECTLSYGASSGELDKIEFYPYNDTFYVAKKGDNTSMLVSRQTIKQVIDKGLSLSAQGE